MDTSQLPYRKTEPRARTKRRALRHEGKVKKSIRAQCVDRDGYCRVSARVRGDSFSWGSPYNNPCSGPSEWAHLGEKKRARTRGQAPEVRHTTAGSLMLCRTHHEKYDAGKIAIEGSADVGLNFAEAA